MQERVHIVLAAILCRRQTFADCRQRGLKIARFSVKLCKKTQKPRHCQPIALTGVHSERFAEFIRSAARVA